MASRTKQRPKKRPVQHPQQRVGQTRRRGWWPWAAVGGAIAVAIAIAAVVVVSSGSSGDEAANTAVAGLPDTPDYHSLLVAAGQPESLALGTHDGIYESSDGGRSWRKTVLAGQDAMNLAAGVRRTVWTAGHDVLARSEDGGLTWRNVQPGGLPHLDVHGFAVDPRDGVLWAALAGDGLYRSRDGGASFELVTREVGAGVMALAVTEDGRILAGDMQQGLMESSDEGRTWRRTLEAGLMGIAANPGDPKRIVATGPGILLSTDGGRSWRTVKAIEQGAGPVAWAPSTPDVGYVVGFDGTLYKTSDGGRQWKEVS